MTNPRFTPVPPQIQQTPDDGGGEIDLMALLNTVWRGKWVIMICAVIAILVGGYYAFKVAVPVYTANAVVALEARQEQVADLDSVLSGLSADQATINTEIEVMRSRGLIGKLVERLELMDDPEFNASLRPPPKFSLAQFLTLMVELVSGSEEDNTSTEPTVDEKHQADAALRDRAIDAVLGKIAISNVSQSYVFRISVTTETPNKSASIANALAEVYIQDQLDLKFEATEKATEWLTGRTTELKEELEASENRVKDFNASTDLVSIEALAALNRQVKELRDRISVARTAVAEAEARAALILGLEPGMPAPEVAVLLNERSLTEAASRVQRGRLDRDAFDVMVERIADRQLLEAERHKAQLATLETSLASLEEQIARQSTDLVTLQQYEREAAASRLIYEHFLSRLKETSVQQGIQQADARLLSASVVPRAPSAPRKSAILATSLILGIFAGAALILGREMMQKGIRTSDDLETLSGITVVGQVPVAPVRRRKKLLDYIANKSNSAMAEAIRNLRTTVLMSNLDHPPKVIMLTSSVPSEGKTTQSLGLSHNFSSLGKKVLLIEADIRRRTLGEYFDVPEKTGLLTAIADDNKMADAIYHDDLLGIDILFGEKSKVNAADFFASDRFGAFMKEARNHYDVIVIDTPPVLAVPDARVIGRHADMLLYVVRWDHTPKSQVKTGLRAFQTAKLQIDGMVLSQVSQKGMKRYGYDGGYGYGKGYYEN